MKPGNYIIVVFIIILAATVQSFDQTVSRENLLKRKNEIEKEIELANKLLSNTREKRTSSVQELKLIKTKIQYRNKLIEEINREIQAIDLELVNNTNKLIEYKGELEKAREEYASLIYYAFKNRNTNMNFMYLLASKNVSQFYSRYSYLQQYKDYRLKQIGLINQIKEQIELKINELEENKIQKIDAKNRLLRETRFLTGDEVQMRDVISKLKQQEDEILKQIEEKKKFAKKLEKEIEELIKKESVKNRYESLTPKERLISDDFVKNKGRLPWPTEQGIITDFFGEHEHHVLKNIKIVNNGIDISTVRNAKARAVFNGEVSKVFTIKGANSTVIIRHGNFYTVYHNLKTVYVKAGDLVKTKDSIGEVFYDERNGNTLLHFEVWKELEKQNPEDWLSN